MSDKPKTYDTLITAVTVLPTGEPLYSEFSTAVEIEDEAAGKFVTVQQESGKVSITPDEWPTLRQAIDEMIGRCDP